MKNFRISWKIYFLLICFFILLFCAGLDYDLEFSILVCNEKSIFGTICATFTGLIESSVLTVCSAIFYKQNIRAKISVFKKIIFILLSLICLVLSVYFLNSYFIAYKFNHLLDSWNVLFKILLLVATQCLLFTGAYFFINTEREPANKLALFFMITLLASSVIFNILLKKLWGRPRFWMLNDSEELLGYFTPIWEPKILYGDISKFSIFSSYISDSSDYFKSFPSEHSIGAAHAILFAYFPLLNVKTTKTKNMIIGFIVGVFILLTVQFSRIVLGAHFITDVTFGAIAAISFMWLFDFVIFRKSFKSKNESKK